MLKYYNKIKEIYTRNKSNTLTYALYYGAVTGFVAGLFHWIVNGS
jgi:hypothetical protein|tara:strand:+ start:72 stop:206 length:135 start_codon:yes stop_codon:yes gene_type:complete